MVLEIYFLYLSAKLYIITRKSCVIVLNGKARVQKYSSDALFTPKMNIFKQTILNTAYIKTREKFPLVRKSLPIQTITSRSVGNQSCLQCS